MAETTKIEWAHATVNFWWGCTAVSAGCKNCYAETLAAHTNGVKWGVGQPRLKIKSAIPLALKLQRSAKATGKRLRVFTCSMADFFDAEVDPAWRAEAWETIRACPDLDWIILTKRPENMASMLPPDWGAAGWPNVWLLVSVEDQANADRRIPLLLATPAVVRGVSYEPALGPVNFRPWLDDRACCDHPDVDRNGDATCCGMPVRVPRLVWIIVGGESGPGARPFDLAWARDTITACKAAGVPCFFKQAGARPGVAVREYDEYSSCYHCLGSGEENVCPDDMCHGQDECMHGDGMRLCPECGGRGELGEGAPHEDWEPLEMRDPKGGDPAEWPDDLRVREFPGAVATRARAP